MTRELLQQVRGYIEAAVQNLRPDESAAEGMACADLEKAVLLLDAELALPEAIQKPEVTK
jgi:hypothetical protein